MSRSPTVNVIVEVALADEEYDAEFTVIDVNGGDPAHTVTEQTVFGPRTVVCTSDADWAREVVLETTGGCVEALFGGELPPELVHSRKFLVRGYVVTERCGNPLDGEEWDSWWETENWRDLDPAATARRTLLTVLAKEQSQAQAR